MITQPSTPAGTLELLPAEQAVHDAMLARIRSGFLRYGFPAIETPVFEKSDVLLTKTGGETERQVYFVQSAGSREAGSEPDLALRFDLTVPLARYVAEHENDLVFPFRRSQIQRVYRGERPQKGRYREFVQCDIDVIDRDHLSPRHDAEVAAAIIDILESLEIGPFTLRLNNRRLMRSILAAHGLASEEHQTTALRQIDKLERDGANTVRSSLMEDGMRGDAASSLLTLIADPLDSVDSLNDRMAGLDLSDPSGLDELLAVVSALEMFDTQPARYAIDLSIARGLDYYTGTVYETVLDNHPELGSVCSGGRYDNLAGEYTRSRLPGVGVSIGFTRLFGQLRDSGLLPNLIEHGPVTIALLDEGDLGYSLGLARSLREAGLSVVSVIKAAKLGRQLKNADRRGSRFVIIAGGDERQRGVVALKDLKDGSQVEVSPEAVLSRIEESRGI